VSERPEGADGGESSLGTPNDWQQIEPLIDAVLDAPPDRREAVARELSGGDDAVFARLQDLAADCARNHRLLDRPAAERFVSLFDADPFPVPDLLAERYRITRELGRGGMARVYLARDLKHSRDVAVKVLRPELAAFVGPARFLKEIEIVAQLRHPHIVPLHDSGESDGLLFYVMPYEEGLSLRQRLERDGPLPVREAIGILRDVCEALACAHAAGIVHRDIKPDNVLLSANHALVADFGVARLVTDAAAEAEAQTVPGVFIGTPVYMAPEQAMPDVRVDHRVDLYAFGVLAHELLVGKPPFVGDSYEAVLAAHLTQVPAPVKTHRPEVPPELDELIMRCLAKKPADRWPSADEILRRLERIGTAGVRSGVVPTSLHRWRWASLAAGVAALAVLSLAWWRTHDRTDIDPNRVAVVRFRNGTGIDSMKVFGSIIADVITNGLARTGAVNVAPAAAVMAAMAPQTEKPAPNDPPSIARATGAGIIVTGSYFARGDSLAIQAEMIDVARGRPLTPIDLVTVPFADQQRGVPAVLEHVAVALSGHVNPRIADLVGVSKLPMSMAAYREYAEALDLYARGERARALRHAYQAIGLDSTSASALLLAAVMEWGETLDLPKVDSLLRIVERSKTELAPYDLAQFEWLHAYLGGDLEAVLRTARRRPDLMAGNAVVQASMLLNRLDEAYALITDVMKRPSAVRHPISWEFLTQTLHMRGDYTRELREARNGLAEMRRTASDSAIAGLLEYEIRALAALGRLEELQLALNELRALRPTSDAFASATRELRWHSHPDGALVIGRLAEEWYRDALTHSSDRRVRLALAETLFELQEWEDARAAFAALAAEELPTAFTRERGASRDIVPFAYLGIDDARRGDTAAANNSIKRLVAFDEPYRFGHIPYWQARIAAQLGQCGRAVDLLRQSLSKGTSVYDRLEAREFERLVTCRVFQTLRARTG